MLKKMLVGMTFCMLIPTWANACTVMLVTKGASADGTVIVSHSNDGFEADPSPVFAPARDHKKGSLRPVYPSVAIEEMPAYNCFNQPNLVAPERSEGYNYPGLKATKPLGYIPEVSHTFAYIDANYGVMNEHGLSLGECTNRCQRVEDVPYKEGGGIFYSAELGRVALERAKTAREAIKIMGDLIDEYGLWGTGEALIVADKEEGWILEMTPIAGDKDGFWVAQKIPDGDFFVEANQFRIRSLKEGDPNQMFNPNLIERLKKLGWAVYDKEGNIDWLLSVQGKEFYHPYYSQRRIWRAMSSVAPSKNFSPYVKDWSDEAYPLSVRPDKKLSARDIMNIHRDYYNGTEFDKSQSSLAGLYGTPYHYGKEKGERSILSAKTSYTHITETGGELREPICWYSINTPLENPFVPFAVAKLPDCYNHILKNKYDPTKMYWASAGVMALSHGFFDIMRPNVAKAVENSENESFRLVKSSMNLPKEKFAEKLADNAVKTFQKWKDLYEELLIKYNTGAGIDYQNRPILNTPSKYQ